MYSACAICAEPLGSNEMFETFPVGERLAFDAAKGRLWVVCPHCERWNLSPVEERWEAVEQAERLYRCTRARVSTGNIGLARLDDGTTIIRIGKPLRPEFAAWRYGDQFGRRRRNHLLIGGAAAAVIVGGVVGGTLANYATGFFFLGSCSVLPRLLDGGLNIVVARVQAPGHGIVVVRRRDLGTTRLEQAPGGAMFLRLRFRNGTADFEGREAERVAALLMPRVNRFGGAKDAIQRSVAEIDDHGGPEGYLATQMRFAAAHTRERGLYGLPGDHALAFEMALHEERERRFAAGELAELEAAWQQAERIAAISDRMFVSEGVQKAFRRLKGN
jgi:hypothetical protein